MDGFFDIKYINVNTNIPDFLMMRAAGGIFVRNGVRLGTGGCTPA